ncbi:hypothetical protein [Paracoccus sp. (in: a-proteobacteria)]|uniref:hypothetical protein n=1 Tax=Paracoccus sp. TaxID=267 RepID=UPI0026E07479|nr:hypothetical protein [Paracoccus sp. (in: a-proteobacteria)]MDO5648916.1 hypothetical protein [Paracoccus sp. (in: a-proteobacteria)]
MRPEIQIWLRRHAEALICASIFGFGVWIGLRGGLFFGTIGIAVALVGLALLIGALRRLAFRRAIAAPGVVELVEGAIRYYGATFTGGEIPVRELTQIDLMDWHGHAHWRLHCANGILIIPVDAAGAAVLADAFTALPGVDMGAVAAALDAPEPGAMRILWRKGGEARLT